MLEAALVFLLDGKTLQWHLPAGRSASSIPDSSSLWAVMFANRAIIGGVAHLHPWDGPASPSHVDLTTFAACEAGLGRRLTWPILTYTSELHFVWTGPGRLDYAPGLAIIELEDANKLRELGRQGV